MISIKNLYISKVQHVKKCQIMANAEINGKLAKFMVFVNSMK